MVVWVKGLGCLTEAHGVFAWQKKTAHACVLMLSRSWNTVNLQQGIERQTVTTHNTNRWCHVGFPLECGTTFVETAVSRLVDAFADILELEASPVEGQQLQKKKLRKGEKEKAKKRKKN